MRVRRPERIDSRRLTSWLFGGWLADLLLFPGPLCFCCWGFGDNLSDGKEDWETPALIGGVLEGVGFIRGVPECMRSGVSGLFGSAQHKKWAERSDPVDTAFVGCIIRLEIRAAAGSVVFV